ncbi:hypothetical protein CF70_009415 [Cupriavidus sp. SK-3]|jgi:hypothetical protein|uniref:hypothetical protein n=1 Tax=unclassified Cupriavidus TaxID=2640874 RepID=UPI00044D1EAA|nr:hypothetical protein [Cupriavidus sp. SK-3]KDP86108.1 hypothetical protein CF70_009415 [Cupriavidus sp. SK-3]
MLSALTFGLMPLAAAAALGTERAGRNLLVQGGCLALLAADWAQAGDAALLQRMLFPGLGEVLSVWGPLAFAGLFGWALRTARAL